MIEIETLFSDEHILVVNKPSGLSTIPDGYNSTLPHLKGRLEANHDRLWIVHRLDKDTSGVIILARTPYAHRALNMQFESRSVNKTYHALIIGTPHWEDKIIKYPLRKNGDRKHRTIVDNKRGRSAVTNAHVLHRYKGYCHISASPETGYTHQIRSHLAAAGFPVLSDPLYSKPANASNHTPPLHYPLTEIITRSALHAYSLEFTHPHLDSRMKIQASYPRDFNEALLYLQEKESGA